MHGTARVQHQAEHMAEHRCSTRGTRCVSTRPRFSKMGQRPSRAGTRWPFPPALCPLQGGDTMGGGQRPSASLGMWGVS